MQTNSEITLDLDDCERILEAEEALRRAMDEHDIESIPGAQPLFDLFGASHRVVLAAERRTLGAPSPSARPGPMIEIVSRRQPM